MKDQIDHLTDLNSEAVLKQFSMLIKQDMMDYAMKHKEDFESDIETVIVHINGLEEQDLLALYVEGHCYDKAVMDLLVHTQDDKLPF